MNSTNGIHCERCLERMDYLNGPQMYVCNNKKCKKHEEKNMNTRAKFYVVSRTELHGSTLSYVVKMNPVISGSKENESFYKWTPSGSLELGTINAEVAEQFKPGKQFYLDFTEAE